MAMWARLWLVIGQWAGRGGPEGEGLPPAPHPPPPESGAPGKVSAAARDSPWPLPPARAAELGPPDGSSPGIPQP